MAGLDPGRSALAYAERGWGVFPLHSPTRQGCSCGRSDCGGKHPRTTHGFHDATTDPQAIERWWSRWPNAGVGIRTGAPSGLVVVDVDPGHDGPASFAALVREHGGLRQPPPRVRTGGNGWHLYFAHPAVTIRNDAGRRLGPGLDVRGDGGYVVAPPSGHPSGHRYRWVGAANRPPPMPAWLIDRLAPPPAPPRQSVSLDLAGSRLSRYASAALRAEADTVARATEGDRNDTLNRAAFNLGQLVGGDALDHEVVRGALHAAAEAAGLGQRETVIAIASGLRAGMERPRALTALSRRSDQRFRTRTERTAISRQPDAVIRELSR